MKIKTKLTLGVGLLFLLIFLLSGLGVKVTNDLKADTNNILAANYKSILYMRNILTAIDSGKPGAERIAEKNIHAQEINITEPGEKEVVAALREAFLLYQKNENDSLALQAMRNAAYSIIALNMDAIQSKSEKATATAERAVKWIAVSGTLCFLIAFVLLINLPANIANPVKELTASIKQIASEDYAQRVHFQGHSEFGELARSFNTMASKLEEFNNSNLAKLLLEKKRIETLINNMLDPVIGLDENLQVLFANTEALQITGLREEEMIGQNATTLAVKNDLMRTLVAGILHIEPRSNERPAPVHIYFNNRESYFEKELINIRFVPTGESESRDAGHVIILRNITQFKELDAAKTNFIATVSHEFKTPIASIHMSLDLLQNEKIGSLNEEQEHLLGSIRDDASRLLNITGELLNMSQVESGNIKLDLQAVDVQEIIQYTSEALRVQLETKQIGIKIDIAPEIPKVIADRDKTIWVLNNLLSNAIRYSYEHTEVLIRATTEKGTVTITVEDSGRGIAPQYTDKIFDRYFRVPGDTHKGTGLGLAICREFMEAQHGTITVKSELGAGTTFYITLPAV